MAKVLHISDLHFGRPAAAERLESLRVIVSSLAPDAVAVSGDLTQRCTRGEFIQAREYLDSLRKIAPYVVVPGNHDIRWLSAVARNLGFAGMVRDKVHEFKYSRYKRYISEDLSPSLEVPGAVIAGLNTAHGISRGSLTRRFKDLGVIGHIRQRDIESVRNAFEKAAPDAARIVMIHHNPIEGAASGRHGLANSDSALRAFAALGAELVLCGHDHQEALHNVEKFSSSLVVSTAGTISNRLRPGRASTFNLVETGGSNLKITTYSWRDHDGFVPSGEHIFPRRTAPRSA